MKLKSILLLILLLAAAAMLFYSTNIDQNTTAPHGGIIKQAGGYNIELKSFNTHMYTYLLDQKIKPVSNKGISCEIKFLLPDNSTMNSVLKTFQDDGFVLEKCVAAYQSCEVIFNLPGQSVSAKFENENIFVKK